MSPKCHHSHEHEHPAHAPIGSAHRSSKLLARLRPVSSSSIAQNVVQFYTLLTCLWMIPASFFLGLLLPGLSPATSTILHAFVIDLLRSNPAGVVGLYFESLVFLLLITSFMLPARVQHRLAGIFHSLTTKRRYRRSHISSLRDDRYKQLVKIRPFTVFLVPANGPSIPLVVSDSTQTSQLYMHLACLQRQPSRRSYTHILYTSGSHPHALWGHETMRDLCAGNLTHFHVRCLFLDSPAKRTRSKDTPVSEDTVVLNSPVKKRKRGELTDEEVWNWPDEKIIDESRAKWVSDVYKHYSVSIKRYKKPDGRPLRITFIFTCKDDPKRHPEQTRDRMRTSDGTMNLKRGLQDCLRRRNVSQSGTSAGAQQTLENSVSRYTPARHRALIAARVALSRRPFNMVKDPHYIQEVELLRPGTVLPSPSTVSQDVRKIYEEGAKLVKAYFERHVGSIHLVMDGWTAPFSSSYLGIVVIWCANGKIWRSILEFIRLKERHTGAYLGDITAQCLKRFGLTKKFHAISMDNASNCDVAVDELAYLIESFHGRASRTRCVPHTVNLIAKAFLSFFYRQPKRKGRRKPSKNRKKHGDRRSKSGMGVRNAPTHGASASTAGRDEHEHVTDDEGVESDGDDKRDAEIEELDEAEREMFEEEATSREDGDGGTGDPIDPAKQDHDDEAVSAAKAQAIESCKQLGITMTKTQQNIALGIFPKVAGLARRLRDSPTLQESFERHIEVKRAQPTFPSTSTKTHLDCRVPTRWNSDCTCLNGHVELQHEIRGFVSDPEHKLQHYSLSDAQWNLAKQLQEALIIFKNISDRFSQAEVPLAYEVIPMLEDLEHQLQGLRDDKSMSNVIRIAAQAALQMVGKYYALTDECEVYRIAIAMCPTKKLVWFERNLDWHDEDRVEARRVVIERWEKSYAGGAAGSNSEAASTQDEQSTSGPGATSTINGPRRSKWYVARDPIQASSSSVSHDTIQAYLDAPLVSDVEIEASGGLIKYWEHARITRPRVAQMALDFLSAPASSVDAERAFSCGRLQVNHLQHNMGSQSFKAQMAIGSWLQSPLLNMDEVTKIVENGMSRKGKGKAQESSNDNDVIMVE